MWDNQRWGIRINPAFCGLWMESQGWAWDSNAHYSFSPPPASQVATSHWWWPHRQGQTSPSMKSGPLGSYFLGLSWGGLSGVQGGLSSNQFTFLYPMSQL